MTGETYVCIVRHGERGRGRGKERVCVEERQNIMNLFRGQILVIDVRMTNFATSRRFTKVCAYVPFNEFSFGAIAVLTAVTSSVSE